MKLVFDIETNGLLYELTTIHCICLKDLQGKEVQKYPTTMVPDALPVLQSADLVIGHNICGFDLLAIEKLYPSFRVDKEKIRDTLCMSKLFNPDRPDHSLEGYGEEYGRHKVVHEDWSTFSTEMLHRCSEDVAINELIYDNLVQKYCRGWKWLPALFLEQDYSRFVSVQEVAGVDVDIPLAHQLIERLDKEISELDRVLLDRIPPRIRMVGNPEGYKPFKKDGTYNELTKKWFSF